MEYPKTLAALRDQEDRSWAVADALVEEIRTHDGGRVLNGEFDRCATWLADQGFEVTPSYLRDMRQTALKFNVSETLNSRHWHLPFRCYMEATKSTAWTPRLMDQAEQERWTLREFSQKLTGKRWADDEVEAAKRVLRDPVKRREVAVELEPEERDEVSFDLRFPAPQGEAQARSERMEGTKRDLLRSQARNEAEDSAQPIPFKEALAALVSVNQRSQFLLAGLAERSLAPPVPEEVTLFKRELDLLQMHHESWAGLLDSSKVDDELRKLQEQQ